MYSKKNINLYLQSNYKDYLQTPSFNQIKKKNLNEVVREFDKEEWKNLYKKVKNNNLKSIKQVDHEYNNLNKQNIYFFNKNFYKNKNSYILNKYIEVYKKTLTNYLNKKNSYNLVELGSGYGSKIINLALSLNKDYKINYYSGN